MRVFLTAVAVLLSIGFARRAITAEPKAQQLEQTFTSSVQPFIANYCVSCHGPEAPKGKLDLAAYSTFQQANSQPAVWQHVLERVEAKEMPPEDAQRQPTEAERTAVINWIRDLRQQQARANAGDPGVVPVRRLNSAEYNYTIRDLTGVDIRPTREFPVDPANEAGFDNSAESLTMSPALLKKYVDAARFVVDHLVLTPQTIAFAPHPAMTDTDRDKFCVNRIIDFYRRQPTDLSAYFLAAWRYQHRTALGQPTATLSDFAAASSISPKYLATVCAALTDAKHTVGPLAKLQTMWQALPSPADERANDIEMRCRQMREWVQQLRRKLEPSVKNLKIQGVHDGSQSFVLWKNRQYAANRRTYSRAALFEQATPDQPVTDTDLAVPTDEAARAPYEASFAEFCSVFPDAFYIPERGRDYVGKPRDQQEKGRLLSAGFHSQMGYFRDDGPLYDMVLSDAQRAELDALWQELDFMANVPTRQYQGFLWFERTDSRFMRDAEFDFARAEDKDAAVPAKIERLAEVYLAKARENGGEGVPLAAIADYFREMEARVRWVDQARIAAEPRHLDALLKFAERAYRRTLTAGEREGLVAFYRELRQKEELTHEEALQDAIVSVLMSPQFCYRMDLVASSEVPRPLNDDELASRLSYFLWSSMPDSELFALAAAKELHQPEVLANQARRMLTDRRVRGLALEFGGNWLDFRRFDQHNSVDRNRFPTFTNELRQAMFEEPTRFFVDLIARDGSVLDFLYARHTFVNRVLAEHYNLPDLHLDGDEWVRVDEAANSGRGGVLPMAAFLTQNAPGLRTSPVKRGYWVVRRLLGERIPAPPPNVPELPSDESQLGELTLRQTLAMHRDHASCAGCHERFDALGLVFEGYGPIGERRERDLGGRAVDTSAVFPGGSEGAGLDGLRTYLRNHRQQDFLDNLCQKLLSYALGRNLLPSDDETVDRLRQQLAASDYRFSSLIEQIVASPQFLTKRGAGPRSTAPPAEIRPPANDPPSAAKQPAPE